MCGLRPGFLKMRKRAAKDGVNNTAKIQKDTIRGCLERWGGATKPEGWLPRYMQFPMQSYAKLKRLPPAEQWKGV